MDSYWNLSNPERADLTEEQVDRLTKIALMEEGVVTPKEPELYEEPPDPQIDMVEMWKVNGEKFPATVQRVWTSAPIGESETTEVEL